jgi:hypothetical protein
MADFPIFMMKHKMCFYCILSYSTYILTPSNIFNDSCRKGGGGIKYAITLKRLDHLRHIRFESRIGQSIYKFLPFVCLPHFNFSKQFL